MNKLLSDGLTVLGITIAFSSSFALLGLALLGLSRSIVLRSIKKS